jgi:hypothetical protein
LNRQFLDYENFGAKINESTFLGKYIEDIIAEDDTPEEKITKIHSFVKKNVKWDGNSHKYLRSNFKKVLENKKGSSAEINLLLTTMLKKSGLDADPVLISTRSNGFVKQHSRISDQFNYVLCKVALGDKFLLIDATEEYLPINALPERCLNGIGYVISETNLGWVNIPSIYNKKTSISGEVTISEEGELTGSLNYKYDGYNGLSQRKKYFKKGENDFIADIKSDSKWEIEKLELEDEKEFNKPFIIKYQAIIDEGAESMGNLIYLDPILSGKYEKNPFTLEKREYPIDFSCPIEEIYYVTYNIPEGYGLETLIKPFAIALPDRAGLFSYKIIPNGNKLVVLSKLNINKTLFPTEEYPYLKEFFAHIVAKQNEQVVLKKM